LDATLSNTGIGPLTVTVPTAASVTGAGFSFVSTTCSTSLAAGSSCAIKVRYTASGTSAATGSLVVSTGAGSKTSSLNGQSQQTIATLTSASTIALADWYATGSITGSFTYRNDGNIPLTLSNPSLSSPLSVSANTCTSVAAGASCAITVALTRNANNGGSSGQSFTASGAGVSPAAATVNWAIYSVNPRWSSTSLSFGTVQVGQSSTQNITLYNDGSVAANWASNNSVLNLPAQYSMNLSACSSVAPNGGSCVVPVTYSPNSAAAHNSGGVYMSYASVVINLLNITGSGASQAASITDINYGGRSAGSSTDLDSTLTNTGVGPLSITPPSSASVSGSGFTFVSTTCSSTLAASSSCAVKVRYSASGTAAASGSLSFSTGAGTKTAALNGQSQQPILTLSYPGHPLGGGIYWGNVYVGDTASSSAYTLTNTGNATATSVALSISTGWAISGSNCGATLAAGASCTFTTPFSPTAAQTYAGTLSVSGAGAVSSGSYSLNGTGVAKFSQATLTSTSSQSMASWYGDGQKSVAYTYRNDGNQAMTLSSPSLSAPLQVIGNTCSGIAAGSSCTITVALNSTAAGAGGSSSQSFTASGATYNPASVTTSWTIYSAVPQWSTTSLAFVNVSVGQSSSQNITLYNYGSVAYNWAANSGIANQPGGFSFDTSACSNVAPNGGSCNVRVTFTPGSAGAYGGGSIYPAAASFVNNYLTVSGTGTTQSVATLTSASSITLADWYQSGAITGSFTYRNDGNTSMTLNSPSLSSPLSVSGNSCSGIAPGGSCTITVAMSRSANGGGSGSQSFTASGATVAPAGVTVNWAIYSAANTWATTSLSFGNVNVGSSSQQTVSVTNSGSAAINWSGALANLPSGFSANTSACSNVAPGGSCSVTITFTPSAGGNYGGGSIYPSNISYANNYLTVSGTGVALTASISVSPTTASFGTVNTGSTSSTSTHTVTAGGNTATTGISISAPSGFNIVSNNCGTSLNAGSSCTFGVTFSPGAAQAYSGNVTVSSSNGGSPTVAVSGTGQVSAQLFTISSTTAVTAGTLQYTYSGYNVTNPGPATVITGISTAVDTSKGTTSVMSATSTCAVGATLASGATCFVETKSIRNCAVDGSFNTQLQVSNAAGTAVSAWRQINTTSSGCK
jgi:hypothetical protein